MMSDTIVLDDRREKPDARGEVGLTLPIAGRKFIEIPNQARGAKAVVSQSDTTTGCGGEGDSRRAD